MNSTSPTLSTKNHYQILDGLRGVAAITVVIFHSFEAFAEGTPFKQHLNHGYLAVDFFFLLSGFVVAYAYDDRWGKMTQWEFYKRRLIRLQPMVIMGSVVGALFFYFGAGPTFPLIAGTPVVKMLLVMLVGFTLIPLFPSMDIRGWQEMHPLDGPAWSLFFEYVANILYAIGLRKLSNKLLGVFVLLSGVFLGQYLLFGSRGDVIGGWALDRTQMHVGFARLLYPFFGGMLLMRVGKRIRIPNAFFWCSLILFVSLAFPRVGGPHHVWVNGLYECLCIMVIFPAIVAMGAGALPADPAAAVSTSDRVSKFLGEISYPLYITHYPLIYVYTAWAVERKVSGGLGALVGAGLLLVAILIAYGSLKLYDEPLRAWLARRFLTRKATVPAAVMQ